MISLLVKFSIKSKLPSGVKLFQSGFTILWSLSFKNKSFKLFFFKIYKFKFSFFNLPFSNNVETIESILKLGLKEQPLFEKSFKHLKHISFEHLQE